MDLKNHIIINLSDKQQGRILINYCSSWYTFSEPIENIQGGVLIKESLSISTLLTDLNLPISSNNFREVTHHNSHIPIYKLYNEERCI